MYWWFPATGMTLIDKLKNHISINDILILIYIVIQVILVLIFGKVLKGFLLAFYLGSGLITGVLILFPRSDEPSFVHFVKTIYPLVLIYFFYRLIGPQTMLLDFNYNDVILYSIERNFIGIYPVFALQRIMEIWLNELSYLFYCLGLLLPLWIMIKLYSKKHLKYFENYVLAAEIGCLTCLVIASIFPVKGPAIALNGYFYLSILGPWFSNVVPYVMTIVSPATGNFPSIYFCIVIVSAYYLWDFGRAYIFISFVLIAGVFWGGVYLRCHYLADGLAALLIAFLSTTIAGILYYLKYGKGY